MHINKRLRLIREKVEGPRGKLRFAKRIGESHSNVSRYERGRTIPAHVLARVTKEYGISAEWLLSGKGDMLAPTAGDEVRALEVALPKSREGMAPVQRFSENDISEFYVLPLLRDPTAAGPGRRITDHDIEGPAIIHRAWCPNPARTDYVRVKGNSMEPVIPDGAIVTIDKTYTDPARSVGHVAAIYIGATEEVTIRRLQRDDVAADRYVGVPDNPSPQNRPHVIEDGDRIIGRVVSVHALVR